MGFLRRRAVRIILDTGLLVGFVAEFATREGPGYDLHSWIGVALLPLVGMHLASSWRWVSSTFRRRQAHPDWQLAKFNAVFATVTAVCILSGFPIWLEWSDSGAWSSVHNTTGFISILLALGHLWLNRQRFIALTRRRALTPST